jgi:hypothetical protein
VECNVEPLARQGESGAFEERQDTLGATLQCAVTAAKKKMAQNNRTPHDSPNVDLTIVL